MNKYQMVEAIENKIELLEYLKRESEDLMEAALQFGDYHSEEYVSVKEIRDNVVKQLAELDKKIYRMQSVEKRRYISRFELNMQFQLT